MKAKTKTITRVRKVKPAPQYFYVAESILTLDNQYRLLTIIQEDKHLCSECFTVVYANQCARCKRYICDACSDWVFHPASLPRTIDVRCPCTCLLHNDFY